MGHNVKETQHLSLETSFFRRENGMVETKFDFIPSVGNHFFVYKNTWIAVERTRDKQSPIHGTGAVWESISIRMLGRNKTLLFDLLTDAKQLALRSEEGRTIIFNSFGSEWRQFGFPRKRRPIGSVVLPDGIAEMILNDVKEFTSNAKWYIERGIPYRRGYLLYGPPGCGKSSFIQALAGELSLNICLLSLSERGLTDDRLNHLLTVAPERSIILLEDVDAAFAARNTNIQDIQPGYGNHITFSGLLNTLDGVAAAEGRILFMTTNHPEKLDPALIRPGRVDLKIALGNSSKSQIRTLFANFYPEASQEQINLFTESVAEDKFSMAQLQGYFLLHKNNPTGALENLFELGKLEKKL